MAVEPDVWFLDEPFSALDPLIRKEMQDEFMRLQTMLNKSIVFVTHDFDEAVRLGDRIAIMKDGALIQIGTAEELVMNPADDYVEKFVTNAPRAKLISVGSVMGSTRRLEDPGVIPDNAISVDDRLEDIAQQVMLSPKALTVVDENGQTVGSITKEKLVEVLF